MKRLRRSLLISLIGLSSLSSAVFADEEFVIKNIQVEGLQRISEGTVFNAIPVKVGDILESGDAAEILKTLYKAGYFSDVKLSKDKSTLIIQVVERPAIGRIDVNGNKDIDTDDLMKALKSVGISDGRSYDSSVLEKVTQELEQQYYSRGKYAVDIKANVEKLPRNRVSIVITINEGQSATIKQISIIGNQSFDESTLVGLFKLTTPGWLTWFTNSDHYEKEKLRGDLEALRSFYLDHGYLHFNIDSTQVSITPDKRDIYITINVTEGDKYTVSGFNIAGQTIVPESELSSLITVKANDAFNNSLITESIDKLIERMGDDGYAFAKVNAVQDVDDDKKQVFLTFFVEPSNRVYVRRIQFFGNDSTEANVLRREMRQMESTWLSGKKIKQSRTNLMLLGFFEDVQIDTKPVPGIPDEVDIDVSVKEQPSGQVTGGVGFSQVDGLLFNLGVKQTNFLGTGELLDFAFQRSSAYTSYRINYNDPYWTVDGVSRGYGIYYQETDLSETNITNFSRDIFGGALSFGIPLTEKDRLGASLNLERVNIKIGNQASQQVIDYLREEGSRFDIGRITLSWNHLALDRRVFPTKGLSTNFVLQAAVPGSDLQFYKATTNAAYYIPLTQSRRTILLFKGRAGYGGPYGSEKSLPIYENFYSGGISSVRGYRGNTLGPRDSRNDPLGGNIVVNGSAELILPMPFVESKAIRTSLFLDAGNVYSRASDVTVGSGQMRYSVGATLQWMSPVGPFVVSFAQPINDRALDDVERFQFTIGTTF